MFDRFGRLAASSAWDTRARGHPMSPSALCAAGFCNYGVQSSALWGLTLGSSGQADGMLLPQHLLRPQHSQAEMETCCRAPQQSHFQNIPSLSVLKARFDSPTTRTGHPVALCLPGVGGEGAAL